MHWFLTLALALWALSPAGPGCGGGTQPPTLVPFSPIAIFPSYHAGAFNEPTEPAVNVCETQVLDNEWNGVNDYGPADTDEADCLDPHMFWDYRITGNGKWNAINYVWADHTSQRAQTSTWTGNGLAFSVVAGGHYFVTQVQEIETPACISQHQASGQIRCPGMAEIQWFDFVGSLPAWQAPVTADCTFTAYTLAMREGVDPSVPREDCYVEDTFALWRQP